MRELIIKANPVMPVEIFEQTLNGLNKIIIPTKALIPEVINVVFQIGRYTFDSQKQLLSIDGESVKLTTKEAELLALLGARVNELLQRDYALKTIWVDDNYFNARSMDVYITKLRKHLKKDSNVEILNVHGKGYKLIIPEQSND